MHNDATFFSVLLEKVFPLLSFFLLALRFLAFLPYSLFSCNLLYLFISNIYSYILSYKSVLWLVLLTTLLAVWQLNSVLIVQLGDRCLFDDPYLEWKAKKTVGFLSQSSWPIRHLARIPFEIKTKISWLSFMWII